MSILYYYRVLFQPIAGEQYPPPLPAKPKKKRTIYKVTRPREERLAQAIIGDFFEKPEVKIDVRPRVPKVHTHAPERSEIRQIMELNDLIDVFEEFTNPKRSRKYIDEVQEIAGIVRALL